MARPVAAVSLTLLLGSASAAGALETDQFYAWGKPLDDSSAALNRRVNAEIEAALREIGDGRDAAEITCDDVERAVVSRFRYFLFQQIENWAVASPEVDRIPRTQEEIDDYQRKFVYGPRPGVDLILWMPPSPTIEAGGVRFGTDKLSHFFSQGLRYHRAYVRALAKAASEEEAERHAVEWGYMVERTFLGFGATGVLSLADLEANERGMHFWNGLCRGPEATVEPGPGGWRIVRPFDVRSYVSPNWDESWQPNVYKKRRWDRVRPVMERYCPLLADPRIRAQREGYRTADRETATDALIRDLAARGKLPDPAQFDIETVCSGAGLAARTSAPHDQSQRPARF